MIASLLAFLVGCSSSTEAPTTTDGATDAAAEAADTSSDAGSDASDAVEADAPASGCTAKRTPAAAPTCGEDCDVRLLLPGGDKYCTMTCAADKDCAPLGTGLMCSSTVGTCVPACKTDPECTAAGFERCDTTVGGCDTM
ncbi:MAG: hypothetical protein JNL79_21455 [Myxococcales bacterium]|nr:hypothetical protein [Myxococcales bacterium]